VSFCTLAGFMEVSVKSLFRMAGTTRLELATSAVTEILRFYNNIQDRGDCQTPRKSYKTSHSVGWVVGWKSAFKNATKTISQFTGKPRAGTHVQVKFPRTAQYVHDDSWKIERGF
jgi:hypothetical protein